MHDWNYRIQVITRVYTNKFRDTATIYFIKKIEEEKGKTYGQNFMNKRKHLSYVWGQLRKWRLSLVSEF